MELKKSFQKTGSCGKDLQVVIKQRFLLTTSQYSPQVILLCDKVVLATVLPTVHIVWSPVPACTVVYTTYGVHQGVANPNTISAKLHRFATKTGVHDSFAQGLEANRHEEIVVSKFSQNNNSKR